MVGLNTVNVYAVLVVWTVYTTVHGLTTTDIQDKVTLGYQYYDQMMADRQAYAAYDVDTVPHSCRWAMGRLHFLEPDGIECEKGAVVEIETSKLLLKTFFSPNGTVTDLQSHPIVAPTWRISFPKCHNTECEEQCNDPHYTYYRTANGACNNDFHRSWGKSFTAQQRLLDPIYGDVYNLNEPRSYSIKDYSPLPSARYVTSCVFRENPSEHFDRDTRHTVLLMAWGQFLDHDITLTPTSHGHEELNINCCADIPDLHHIRPECFPISIKHDDPVYHNRSCMNFVRSAPATRTDGYCKPSWREQLNQVTSYVDASNVYGSTIERQKNLRARYGKSHLLETHGNNFPKANPGDTCMLPEPKEPFFCTKAGDIRSDEVPNLLFHHTLMVREHNRLANKLKYCWRVEQPYYTSEDVEDEHIFQETRKIIIAIIQQITYRDVLPKFLGLKLVEFYKLRVGHHEDNIYDPYVNPGVFNSFAAAAWRIGHSMIPRHQGFNHNKNPYLTAYMDQDFQRSDTRDTFFRPAFLQEGDGRKLGKFVQWMLSDRSMNLDGHFVADVQDHLFEVDGEFGEDLPALNIQRGRDHGLKPYIYWRKYCQVDGHLVNHFDQLQNTHSHNQIHQLKKAYAHVEDIDLFAGAITERHVQGGLVGPTFGCIIAHQFKALKLGDSFWYERRKPHDESSHLTEDQIHTIQEWSLAKIICENIGLEYIQEDVFRIASLGNIRKCSDLKDINLIPWGCHYADGRENLYPEDVNLLSTNREPY